MAILSALTLIRILSLLHLTASYLLLVSPSTLSGQSLVLILGEAMHLPDVGQSLQKPSEALAFASLLIGLLAVSDLTAASMVSEVSLEYWGAMVPVRLGLLFGIAGWSYLTKEGGALDFNAGGSAGIGGAKGFSGGIRMGGNKATPAELLRNNFVFAAAFLELCVWFWVWVALRDERAEVRAVKARKLNEETEERVRKAGGAW